MIENRRERSCIHLKFDLMVAISASPGSAGLLVKQFHSYSDERTRSDLTSSLLQTTILEQHEAPGSEVSGHHPEGMTWKLKSLLSHAFSLIVHEVMGSNPKTQKFFHTN